MRRKRPPDRQDALRLLYELAEARTNDAVKLAWLTAPEEIDRLNLRGLTELKRNANGTVEVKLADRAAILQVLLDRPDPDAGPEAFLRALDAGGTAR